MISYFSSHLENVDPTLHHLSGHVQVWNSTTTNVWIQYSWVGKRLLVYCTPEVQWLSGLFSSCVAIWVHDSRWSFIKWSFIQLISNEDPLKPRHCVKHRIKQNTQGAWSHELTFYFRRQRIYDINKETRLFRWC